MNGRQGGSAGASVAPEKPRPRLGGALGVLLGAALLLLCALSVNLWRIEFFGGLSAWNFLVVAPAAVFSGHLVALVRGRADPPWSSAAAAAGAVGVGVAGALVLSGGPFSRTSYPPTGATGEAALIYGAAFGVLAAAGGWTAGHALRRSGAGDGPGALRLVAALLAGAPLPVAGIVLPLIVPSSAFNDFRGSVFVLLGFAAFVGGLLIGAVGGGALAALLSGRLERRVAALSASCGLAAACLAAIDTVQDEGPTPYPFLALSFIVVVAPLAGLGGWLIGRARRRQRSRQQDRRS